MAIHKKKGLGISGSFGGTRTRRSRSRYKRKRDVLFSESAIDMILQKYYYNNGEDLENERTKNMGSNVKTTK